MAELELEKKATRDDLQQKLAESVPDEVSTKDAETVDQSLESIQASSVNKLIEILSDSENKRLSRQRPIFTAIIIMLGFQMVMVNGVVIALLVLTWWKNDAALITQLYDFIKYYVSLSVAELLGMLLFITKSSFSSNSKSIINGLFAQFKK